MTKNKSIITLILFLMLAFNTHYLFASASYKLQLKAENESSWSPIHWATVYGVDWGESSTTVAMLLEKGADIESKDSYGRTPLHLAFDHDKLQIAKLFLDRGADIEARDNHGNTVLHKSAAGRSPDAIKLLVEMKADINAKDDVGDTVLEIIWKEEYGEENNLALAEPLITNGINLDTKNWNSRTPFQRAITYGWFDAAVLLLNNGADIDAKDKDGQTVLNFLVMQYHSRTNNKTDGITFLLEHGADPNNQDKEGTAPLHHAAMKSNSEIVALLLKKGADPLLKDKNGKSALDKAKQIQNSEIIDLLISAQ